MLHAVPGQTEIRGMNKTKEITNIVVHDVVPIPSG